MNFFYILLASYLFFSLLRIIYQIASGLIYITPTKKLCPSNKNSKPLVSVIVPAWNEEVGIAKTIRSVMANSYKNIEIIIIDDGSTDSTSKEVVRIKKRFIKNGYKIHLINQNNAGKAEALNTGISISKGELIITLDADSYITPRSINELVKSMANTSYSVAMGEVVVGNTKKIIGKIQHYEYLVGFHFKRSQHIFNSAYIFPGALTIFRASVLKEIGKFENYSSTEDLDISMRIKAGGHKVAYVDTATCITEGATSLKGLLNQRTRWRHGFIDCIIKRKDFVWSLSKGKYLSFIDFPLSLIGVVEVLIYPIILLFLIQQLSASQQIPILIMSYMLLPFVFFILGNISKESKISPFVALMMPIAILVINSVEYIALIKSIYRTLRKKKTMWTIWQRTGIK